MTKRPGKRVASLTVYQSGNVKWGEIADRPRDKTVVIELRQIPTIGPDRYEYLTYFQEQPPIWWQSHHKTLLDAKIYEKRNELSDKKQPFKI